MKGAKEGEKNNILSNMEKVTALWYMFSPRNV
jgi:hypothetical protein